MIKNYAPNLFEHETEIKADISTVFSWHEREGALFRLSPPWENISLIRRDDGIQAGAKCDIKLKTGPVSLTWKAEHIEYEKDAFFKDRQNSGPFSKWEHSHFFSEKDGITTIKDHVEYKLPMDFITSKAAGKFVRNKLEKMFRYRENLCRNDIEFYSEYRPAPKTIVVSGSSGVVGSSLIPFLQTQGHKVIRLLRDRAKLCIGDVCWNPNAGIIEDRFENADAVIHLTGEPIGEGKWTDDKKREIIDSRVRSTALLAETLSKMKNPPKTFICASAIGYYGGRGDEVITEAEKGGSHDFIAKVCKKWEEAAKPAVDKGIRVIFLRIGVVLTPAGGALQRMQLPFSLGLGPVFGSGDQYFSWVAMDDVLYSIGHLLEHNEISGAVNLTAPNAVTSKVFSDTLAQYYKKPRFINIPPYIIEKVYGQMGKEVLLSGANVYPEKLIKSGFRFRYPELKGALEHLLGG
ncbi:TIGR01777 family oxidoreductase [Seleniivibrio woodruffii]|uniref:TIGR01777 family oxidoreductase n=1 Tax=Seleniivibrio woodruffii TaxID=1078050 RepID=UPI0039E2B41E